VIFYIILNIRKIRIISNVAYYETNVRDVDELKQRMLSLSRGLEQSVVSDARIKWLRRLRACNRV